MIATVIHSTRRNATILGENGTIRARLRKSHKEDITVGDKVKFSKEEDHYFIDEVLTRKNCFFRSYRKKNKIIAANLDLLFLITAPGALYNTTFIDRVLATTCIQKIPTKLVVNKKDICRKEVENIKNTYQQIGYDVIVSSAKEENGADELLSNLKLNAGAIVAFTGISGVGKSSLLNSILSQENIRTNSTSHKTGQGRQTTSASTAYTYTNQDSSKLLLVDLPGIQSFGVSHLEKYEVTLGYKEFLERRNSCEYHDCLHISEPNCAIKSAVEKEEIIASRYDTYLSIIHELENP